MLIGATTRNQKAAEWRRQNRRRVLLENRYIPLLRRILAGMASPVADAYAEGGLVRMDQVVEDTALKIEELLNNLYQSCIESSARYVEDEMNGKAYKPKFQKKELSTVLQGMLNIFRTEAFEMSKTIADTYKAELRHTIGNMLDTEEQPTTREVSKQIQKQVQGIAGYKADMIARTETGKALMESQYETINELSDETMLKEWLSGSDARVRRGHREANGQTVLQNVRFKVRNPKGRMERMMYPMDKRASVGNVVNCRCNFLVLPNEADD